LEVIPADIVRVLLVLRMGSNLDPNSHKPLTIGFRAIVSQDHHLFASGQPGRYKLEVAFLPRLSD
jgi:hypothetical protein